MINNTEAPFHLTTIVQGNTRASKEFFNQHLEVINPSSNISDIPNAIKDFCILSSVNDQHQNTKDEIQNFKSILDVREYFTARTNGHLFIDMPVHYALTLGPDRYVQGLILYHALKRDIPALNNWIDKNLSPELEGPIALIDSGTFTTLDLIKTDHKFISDGHFGGPILPGPSLIWNSYNSGEKLKSFVSGTAEQQLSLADKDFSQITTTEETNESLAAGLKLTLISPIFQWLKNNQPRTVVFSGGAGSYLFLEFIKARENVNSSSFKNSIFLCPDLQHYGLALAGKMIIEQGLKPWKK